MKTATIEVDVIWEAPQDAGSGLRIEAFCSELFKLLQEDFLELAILVTDDEEMRGFNLSYRGHDRTTDVLSFPQGGPAVPGDLRHLGNIAISIDQAARQAADIGHSIDSEIYFLVLHGVLHLLGYDHETDDGEMFRLQSDLKHKLADFFGEGRVVG